MSSPSIRTALLLGSSADTYGAPQVLRSVGRALVRSGFRVIMVLPQEGPMRVAAESDGCSVVVLDDYAIRRRYLSVSGLVRLTASNVKAARWIWATNKHQPVDLVWSNTQTVLVGWFAKPRIRGKHVWHFHELQRSPRALIRALTCMARLGTDAVVVPSDAVLANVHDHCVGLVRRCRVVPNGVDQSELAALPQRTRQEGDLHVVCVARLHRWKGHLDLLKAVRQVIDWGESIRLSLYGSAAEGHEDEVRAITEWVQALGLQAVVTLRGQVDDRRAIYSEADLVVVPSIEPEPFSLVTVEALAAGVPVIAANHGGPQEILAGGDYGYVYPPGDWEELARVISVFARVPREAYRKAAAGRVRARMMYSEAAFEDRIRNLIRALGLLS